MELKELIKKSCDATLERERVLAALREERLAKERANAEHAYNTFKEAVTGIHGVDSFEIEESLLASRKLCAVIMDGSGRRFEIHYEKPMINGNHLGGGDLDYHINAQWSNKSWFTYSVSIGKEQVAKSIGSWLAELILDTELKKK